MRVAILSDIHGNLHALDAVLAEVRDSGGADEHWILGDLAAIGADPVGATERLRGLAGVRFVRGNTDRYVVTDERPSLPPDRELRHEIDEGFRWTTARLSEAGLLSWFAELPVEERVSLPDGTRVLLVHASPGTDEGAGFTAGSPTDDEVADVLRGCDADLVLVGHTHRVVHRRIGDACVFNPGSVSNPVRGDDRRAAFAILDARSDGYDVQHRRVGYDLDPAIEALFSAGFPGASYVSGLFREPERLTVPSCARAPSPC